MNPLIQIKASILPSLIALLIQLGSVFSADYSAIYVVGDSLSDTGNNKFAVGDARYWNGRTSNGPMWPELLSNQFGVRYSQANNKAYSGATSYDQSGIPGVVTQVQSLPITSPATGLFIMWIGTNDAQKAVTHYGNVSYATNTLLMNISNAVRILYARGARTIVVLNVYDFYDAPLWRNGAYASSLSEISYGVTLLNARLAAMLNDLKLTLPGLRVVQLGVQKKLELMFTAALNYDISWPYYIGFNDAGFKATRDWWRGEKYCTWDGLHPTSKLHREISAWIYTLTRKTL
jgi:outer membrane lipase/esterase